jgi:adenylate cyclase
LAIFEYTGIFLALGAPAAITLLLFTVFVIIRYAVEQRRAFIWFRQLANAHEVTMESMAAVAESRDPETGAYVKRTQHYVRAIADELAQSGRYMETLTTDYIDLLFASAPLHDIGKVGVPDNILMKPGKLTDEEFGLMKKHAEYGKKIIGSTAVKIEGNNFLILAGEIASTHHEKWDGSGYPEGLAGGEIPLSGRIMAVADVYDALISKRCYKPPFSHEKACGILHEGRGTGFDPVVLDAFFGIETHIRGIAAHFADEDEKPPEDG